MPPLAPRRANIYMQEAWRRYATLEVGGRRKNLNLRVWDSSPRYTRENHYAFSQFSLEFPTFPTWRQHNASSFSDKMPTRFPSSFCKNIENYQYRATYPLSFSPRMTKFFVHCFYGNTENHAPPTTKTNSIPVKTSAIRRTFSANSLSFHRIISIFAQNDRP